MDAKEFATIEHAAINQTYGEYSYTLHLNLCHKVFDYFSHFVFAASDDIDLYAAKQGLWLHDLLEDSWKVSYNDLKSRYGFKVAEIVFLVTEEKGRTRAERHNHKYFTGIASMNEAILVKLCDNLANVIFSCYSGTGMYSKYKAEYSTFKSYLYKEEFKLMFELLEKIYSEDKLPDFWAEIVEKEVREHE